MAQSPGGSIGVIWEEISLYLYYTPCLVQTVVWFSWSDLWDWGQSQGQKPQGKLQAGGILYPRDSEAQTSERFSDVSESLTQSQYYLAKESAIFVKVVWQHI